MPDEPATEIAGTPSAASAPQPPATSTATPAPVFTQAQVDTMLAEARTQAHNAGAAATRRALEGRNGTSTPAQTTPATQQPATAPISTAIDRAYTRATAGYEFDDAALALLDEEFDRTRPPDPVEWVSKRATAFKVPKRGGTATTPTTSTPATAQPASVVAPAGPPVTGNGAPSSPTRVTSDTPLTQMSEADRIAFIRQHGDVAYTDRFKAEARERGLRVPLAALLRR